MKLKYAIFYRYIGTGYYSTNYLFFDSLDKAINSKDRLLSHSNIDEVLLFEFIDYYTSLGGD